MLIERIKSDRITAMKNKDAGSKNLLTTLLGELEGKAKRDNSSISDDMVVNACKKFLSNNNDTMGHIGDANDTAYIALKSENVLLASYMPKQLTEEQIRNIITELDTDNIGAIMKHMNSNYNGEFDRGLAAKIAKTL